jgi:4-hydroxybenzoate polyprenyltransferase
MGPPFKRNRTKALFNLLRPYQWSKNLLLFGPLVFSKKLFETQLCLELLVGFFLFSLASSSVYIFNDIRDIENDRQHPEKQHRPIASGRVSVPFAMSLSIVLGLVSLGGSFYLTPSFGGMVLGYTILNLLYSLGLKQLVILDVMSIAAGFVLRVMAGAKIVEVYPSNWLIICTILLSLFLGFSKRRHELLLLPEKPDSHRKVLKHYSSYFLDQMIAVVTSATVISYMLYTVSEQTVQFFGTRNLIWTVPFVLYGIFRYLYLVHQKAEGGDPADAISRDTPMLLNFLLWVMTCIIIIYYVK